MLPTKVHGGTFFDTYSHEGTLLHTYNGIVRPPSKPPSAKRREVSERPACSSHGESGDTLFTTRLVRKQSNRSIWRAVRDMSYPIYMEPVENIAVDQGSPYVSDDTRQNTAVIHIVMAEALLQNPATMYIVKWYHVPLQAALNLIQMDTCDDLSTDKCLSMAVDDFNDTEGPEGLSHTFLVFSDIPSHAQSHPSPPDSQNSGCSRRYQSFPVRTHKANGRILTNKRDRAVNRTKYTTIVT